VRRARAQAKTELRKAQAARPIRTIGRRHVTGPAPRRTRSGRAGSKNLHPTTGFSNSQKTASRTGVPHETNGKAAATRKVARGYAERLAREVPQFKTLKCGLASVLLCPHVEAGWSYDDLRAWLRLDRVPGWYVKAVGPSSSYANPLVWELPPAERVVNAFGLLAFRCGGAEWRSWRPLARVRTQLHAEAAARVEAAGPEAEEVTGPQLQEAGRDLVAEIRERRARMSAGRG
jgi:hypothetical protein